MNQVNAYLNFDGNCREAMQFYANSFGAELQIMDFSQAPPEMQQNIPAEAKKRILHARLSKGPLVLMASDCPPGMPLKTGDNFYIAVACDTTQEIDRLFGALSQNGKVGMPLGETFWAHRFGMLTDQFGTNWMLSLNKPTQS